MQGLGNALWLDDSIVAWYQEKGSMLEETGCGKNAQPRLLHWTSLMDSIVTDGIAKSRMLEKLQPHASLEGGASW